MSQTQKHMEYCSVMVWPCKTKNIQMNGHFKNSVYVAFNSILFTVDEKLHLLLHAVMKSTLSL